MGADRGRAHHQAVLDGSQETHQRTDRGRAEDLGTDRKEELVAHRLVVPVVDVDPETQSEVAAGIDRGHGALIHGDGLARIGLALQELCVRGIVGGIQIGVDDVKDHEDDHQKGDRAQDTGVLLNKLGGLFHASKV